ncbi:MAG: pyridoxal phosphate-dependent aminotransferase [Desulfovibrio sp.]
MIISDRIRRLKPSATLTINAKTQELRAQGREVVSLAVGEPDFATPQHVIDAAKNALDQGRTRYTPVPGLPELRKAAAGYFDRFYGAKAEAENIICTAGGKQALYNLFMALLNPGDEVLLPGPYWVSYPAMIDLAQGVTKVVPASENNGFLVTIEDLEQYVTDRTRILLLNSPSNPTGGTYSQAQLDELAEWALSKNIFVISDEVYDRLVYAPAKPASLSPFWQKHPENVAVVNALSKSFCLTGMRVGFALAHPELVKGMSKIQGQSTSNINSVTQYAALAAFEGSWSMLDEMNTAFARRRDYVLDVLGSWPGVTCPKPDGAFYVFPVLAPLYKNGITDSTSLCTRMLEEAGVALVPGVAFGDDRCVRISYAVSDDTLAMALDKMAKVLVK